MKKLILAALLACLLLLSGCRKSPAESENPTPAPTQDQTAETPPASPDPVSSDGPDHAAPDFPAFLEDFTFFHAEAFVSEGWGAHRITYQFTEEELAQLKEALALDAWYVADERPQSYTAHYTLYDQDGHSLVVAKWDEERSFIVVQEDSTSFISPSYHYCAPAAVVDALEPYLAKFSFLPDYDPYFDFDQIEVDRTPYEDREGYQDHDVYLLDNSQKLSFLDILDPDTWTVASGDELAVMYSDALRARDNQGNDFNITGWDEEKCLVNLFIADYYESYRNSRTDRVVRYWAPASVLDDALAFVDGLTPLGTIDNEAARYYDLFLADPGFDFVVTASADGGISDDQMAAYMLTILGYEGRIDYELGIPPAEVDEITQKHFGKKIRNYNTSWSKVLPSGNVTATGWDTTSGDFPVLTGTPVIDEYGNITATFQIYSLPEHLWLDEELPWSILGHVREYLLTGHGEVFLEADSWSSVYHNEITFRIEVETVNDIWQKYVVYNSSRAVD